MGYSGWIGLASMHPLIGVWELSAKDGTGFPEEHRKF